jgi:hypothetical protein
MPLCKTSGIRARWRLPLMAKGSQTCSVPHWTCQKVEFGQPRLVSTAFTAEQKTLTNRNILDVGPQRALIARMLGMRTVNEVKNLWKMLDEHH